MNNEVIDMIVAEKAKKEIKDLVTDVLAADKAFLQLSGSVNSFSKQSFKVNSVKDYVSHTKEAVKVNNQLNASDKVTQQTGKALTLQFEKRAQASQALNKALIKQRFETQQINAAEKKRAIISSKLSTEYQKQSAILSTLKREYKDLAAQQLKGNRLTKAEIRQKKLLERQIKKLDGGLKGIDKSVGEGFRSVGRYGKAWQGLGKIMGAALVAFGAVSAIQIGKEIFATIKEIDGLNKALLQVTETQERFNSEQKFVIELAEEAGVEIFTLQKAYTKFLASAKTTNLTIAQTRDIFRQTAKAGSVLGLATDDINGAFRALEQILSKGKVQAEEIRGQLGERLPGAFQILAKSMGLTTAELSKQLELGNVLSEEVLPGFARELEKTYNLDLVKRVDTLVAAQNRLGNEWKLFIADVEGGEGVISGFFKSAISGVAEFVKSLRILNGGILNYAAEKEGLKAYEEQVKSLNENAIAAGVTLREQALKELGTKKAGIAYLEQQKKLNDEALENLKERSNWASRKIGGDKEEAELIAKKNNLLSFQIEREKGRLRAIEEVLAVRKVADKEEVLGGKAVKKQREDELSLVEKMIPVYDLLRERVGQMFQEGTLDAIEFRKALEAINEEQRKLTEGGGASLFGGQGLQGAQITQAQNGTTQDNPIPDTGLVAGEIDLIRNSMGELIDTLGLGQTEFQNFFDSLQTALEKGAEGYDDLKFAAADFLRLAGSGVGALADAKNAAIEQEISDLQRAKEADVNYKRASEAEKERIDAQYAKIIKQKKREQAKNDKDAAVFESIINTIAAVVEALPNVPLSIAVGLIGAANTAAIAAKPLPALKDGDLTGKHQGHVLINDQSGSKYQEIVERQDGSMEMYSGRNVIIDKKRGDKVHKAGTFNGMDLANTSLMLSMQNQQTQLTPSQEQQIINIEIGNQIEKQMSRAINKFQPQKIDYDKLSSTIMWNNEANKA